MNSCHMLRDLIYAGVYIYCIYERYILIRLQLCCDSSRHISSWCYCNICKTRVAYVWLWSNWSCNTTIVTEFLAVFKWSVDKWVRRLSSAKWSFILMNSVCRVKNKKFHFLTCESHFSWTLTEFDRFKQLSFFNIC